MPHAAGATRRLAAGRPARRVVLVLGTQAVALALVLAPVAPTFAVQTFSDGFESGDLSAWTQVSQFEAQQSLVFSGQWAGRATATGGSGAYASRTLSPAQPEVFLRSMIRLESASSTTILFRVKSSSGASLLSLQRKTNGLLQAKNHVSGTTATSTTSFTTGVWHDVQVRALPSGTSSLVQVWLDGSPIADLATTSSLGTNPVGRVQLGGSSSAFIAAFDDVVVDTQFVGGAPPTDPPATPTGLRTTSVTASQVSLAWDPSTGASGYTVYRDGSPIGTTASTSFGDGTVSPSTMYQYAVDAFNDVGSSAPSAAIEVTTPAPSADPIVAAAGDIACDPADPNFNGGQGTSTRCRQAHTGALLAGADAVLALGDTQYECGGADAYPLSYDPSWGPYRGITYPIPGDEEYDTTGTDCGPAGAEGYFGYFGAAAHPESDGYYSFNLGAWHIVGLNAVCTAVGGCNEGSPQNDWLEQDLAADNSMCTLAMVHLPRFASKKSGLLSNDKMLAFWEDLYADGVEMVLSGNSHFYERFAPQSPTGQATPGGVVQFIVGTGGKSHGGLADPAQRWANSAAGTSKDYGVLRLVLRPTGYDFEFVPEGSSTFTDSGTASCH